MAHPQAGHIPDHHQTGDKASDRASLLMVLLSLALFFAMTVVGHFVFVAGNHDTHAPAAAGTTSPHPESH